MKKHLKRLPAPRTWKLERKTSVWAYKPRPGPHGTQRALPLAGALRDILKVVDNAREAETAIYGRDVLVDGRPATDPKFPIGLMDVLTLTPAKANYRVLLDTKGKLTCVPIDDKEAKWKLCRVKGAGTLRGGIQQIRLHDGRSIQAPKQAFPTGTTVKLSVPQQAVLGSFPLAAGHIALLTGGAHAGELVHVDRVERTRNPRANVVHFTEGFSTILEYVFVVGTETPEIRVPEGQAV